MLIHFRHGFVARWRQEKPNRSTSVSPARQRGIKHKQEIGQIKKMLVVHGAGKGNRNLISGIAVLSTLFYWACTIPPGRFTALTALWPFSTSSKTTLLGSSSSLTPTAPAAATNTVKDRTLRAKKEVKEISCSAGEIFGGGWDKWVPQCLEDHWDSPRPLHENQITFLAPKRGEDRAFSSPCFRR